MTDTIESLKAKIKDMTDEITELVAIVDGLSKALHKASSAGFVRRGYPFGQGVGKDADMMNGSAL